MAPDDARIEDVRAWLRKDALDKQGLHRILTLLVSAAADVERSVHAVLAGPHIHLYHHGNGWYA